MRTNLRRLKSEMISIHLAIELIEIRDMNSDINKHNPPWQVMRTTDEDAFLSFYAIR